LLLCGGDRRRVYDGVSCSPGVGPGASCSGVAAGLERVSEQSLALSLVGYVREGFADRQADQPVPERVFEICWPCADGQPGLYVVGAAIHFLGDFTDAPAVCLGEMLEEGAFVLGFNVLAESVFVSALRVQELLSSDDDAGLDGGPAEIRCSSYAAVAGDNLEAVAAWCHENRL